MFKLELSVFIMQNINMDITVNLWLNHQGLVKVGKGNITKNNVNVLLFWLS